MKYYCSHCDVVSPPTKKKMVFRMWLGMRETRVCALCERADELHICKDERIEAIRKSKANQERHRREQAEFRRLKAERKKREK